MPTTSPLSGGSTFNVIYSNNGTTDNGYNITSPKSELAYMYNVNLDLVDRYSSSGVFQPTFGIFGNGTAGGQNNVGLVQNLQSGIYFSGIEYSNDGIGTSAWVVNYQVGNQGYAYKTGPFYAWAVHNGNVFAAPVPGAVWLFGSGFVLLALKTRRKNSV